LIFSRRRIQNALWQLAFISDSQANDFAKRLNRRNADSLAAMWEVMVLHSMSLVGNVVYEKRTESGKNPDLFFESDNLSFTADISCISDHGIEQNNPFNKLLEEIERQKGALGLGVGGVYIDVGHEEDDLRVTLKLPDEKHIAAFVTEEVMPKVAKSLQAGNWPIKLAWTTDHVKFALTIKDGPYSGGGYRAYDIPKTVKANPIYSRLRSKSAQVRDGKGLRGLILCDGGYSAFSRSAFDRSRIDASQIARSFLNGSSDVDFVVLLWVEEKSESWNRRVVRTVHHEIIEKTSNDVLVEVIKNAFKCLPLPKRTGRNARNHLEWKGQDFGFGGGMTMAWPTVKISSTMVLNLLSGRIDIQQFNERLDWTSGSPKTDQRFLNVFERALREGKRPIAFTIESSVDDDDDWINVKFGSKDASISAYSGRGDPDN
jgi:hypothetical protein